MVFPPIRPLLGFGLLAVLLMGPAHPLAAQTSRDAAVQLSASVDTNAQVVRLRWPRHPNAIDYLVIKRDYNEQPWNTTGWASILDTLDSTATGYVDSNVVAGQTYEYLVQRRTNLGANGVTATGFIAVAVNRPVVHDRGVAIVVVEQRVVDSLPTELATTLQDLVADGWEVKPVVVGAGDTVPGVRQAIEAAYVASQGRARLLYLLGHVPVPYSGLIVPDGHPDHRGAWPADVYYASFGPTPWTDAQVNDTAASGTRNDNVPGDGKFDRSAHPGFATGQDTVGLMLGRVDLHDMPAFGEETALLRRYLNRAHAYKRGQWTGSIARRAVVEDNFGYMNGEAFASSAWRGLAPIVGDTNVRTGDFFDSTRAPANNVLWAYGCGGGSYRSASGIGRSDGNGTPDFSTDSLGAVFTGLFGSYFGDWDNRNNFLRAPLAHAGLSLACMWSGRPYWTWHPLAIGKPLGFAAQVSQQISGTQYPTNLFPRSIHIALMGDPSLRMDPMRPATTLRVSTDANRRINQLTWNASPDATQGYHVYRAADSLGPFLRLNDAPLFNRSYVDSTPLPGVNHYMVRAQRWEQHHSGRYANLSLGIFVKQDNTPTINWQVLGADTLCAGDSLTFLVRTTGALGAGHRFLVLMSDTFGDFFEADTFEGAGQGFADTFRVAVPADVVQGGGYRVALNLTAADTSLPDTVDRYFFALPELDFALRYLPDSNRYQLVRRRQHVDASQWNYWVLDGPAQLELDLDTLNLPEDANGLDTVYLMGWARNFCGVDTVRDTFFLQGATTSRTGNGPMANLRLAPNPTTGLLQLLNVPGMGPITWRAISSTGQTVGQGTLPHPSNRTLDLGGLPAGLYQLLLTQDGHTTTRGVLLRPGAGR